MIPDQVSGPVRMLVAFARSRIRRAIGSPLGRTARRSIARMVQYRIAVDRDSLTVEAMLLGREIGKTYVGRMWARDGIQERFSGGTWIAPMFRGIGLGSRMLGLAMSTASGHWEGPIYANVRQDNDISLRMCKGLGFRIIERDAMRVAIEQSYRRRVGHSDPQILLQYDATRSRV